MALIHCAFTVSPPALMHTAACQEAKIDDTVSGGAGAANKLDSIY